MSSPIIYIMGVSGSGKTTIGHLLSKQTGLPFFDGDDYHPESNRKKMSSGQPLNDEDRIPWLEKINFIARDASKERGAIIACSALKSEYRNILAKGIDQPVYWILLAGPKEIILERMKSRKGHFMPPSLLQSQFDTLEFPLNAFVVDIREGPSTIINKIVSHLGVD